MQTVAAARIITTYGGQQQAQSPSGVTVAVTDSTGHWVNLDGASVEVIVID